MRVLELYAGSRSIGKVAEARGHEVFSIDIEDFPNIDLRQDIEFLKLEQIPWTPREKCFNGNPNCKHQRAPRGSKTGTQGLKNNFERSKIPEELCIEVIKSVENYYK